MSHSTTGTSTFLLSKYSRSYPVKRTLQKAQMTSQSGPELMPDWQHFTNPVIRLVLDVKTADNAEIESVKLRILWEINHGVESGANQQDVLFEDLDLLCFSALAPGAPRKNQTEGMPLKAVYRDTVVGIRYLHSREDGVPIYRRFQISFQIPSQASEFIEIIKPICPCKMNPTAIPPPALSQMSTLTNRPTMQRKAVIPSNTALPNRVPSYARPPPSGLPRDTPSMNKYAHQSFANRSVPHSSSPLALHASLDTTSFQAVDTRSFDDRPSMQNPFMQAQTSASGMSFAGVLDQELLANAVQAPVGNIAPSALNLPSSSLPSLPSSSNSAANGTLPTPTNSSDHAHRRETVQPILNEYTSIYNLPNSTLEQLMGEIIHEDGFVQLVERISEMLTVRTLLGA